MTRFDVTVKTIKSGVVREQKVEAIAKSSINAGNQVLQAMGVNGEFKLTVRKSQEVQHG